MKKQKLFGAAAILSLALSLPVYGGDVQTPTAPVPPPPPGTMSTNGTAENPSLPGDTGSPAALDASSDLFIELLLAAFSL